MAQFVLVKQLHHKQVVLVKLKNNIATATVDVVPITDTDGEFINEDGKLSESTMRVQDSLYYQDFSYVVKVGQSINVGVIFKKTMHTSGFYFTGQVNVATQLDLSLKSPVIGSVSGVADSPFMRLINTLFSTIFGRRLGTTTDGTTREQIIIKWLLIVTH